jgi:hypothetical protein
MVMAYIRGWLLQVYGVRGVGKFIDYRVVVWQLQDALRVQSHDGVAHHTCHCRGSMLETYRAAHGRVLIRVRKASCTVPYPEPYRLISASRQQFDDMCRHGYREAMLRVGLAMKELGACAVAGRHGRQRYWGHDIVEMALEDRFPRAVEELLPSADEPCVCKGVRHMPRCEWCERPWAPTLADPGPYHCPVAEFGTCDTFADRRSYILLHDGGYPVDALFAAMELAGERA